MYWGIDGAQKHARKAIVNRRLFFVVVFLKNDMFGKLWKKELDDNFVVVAVVFCVVVTNKAIFAGTLCLCVCVCVCVCGTCMHACVCVPFSKSADMLTIKVETALDKYSTHA